METRVSVQVYWLHLEELLRQGVLRLRTPLSADIILYRQDKMDASALFSLLSSHFGGMLAKEHCLFSFAEELQLESCLLEDLHKHSTLAAQYREEIHLPLLRIICDAINQFESLTFRLQVMQYLLPYEFRRTLFCLQMILFEAALSERSVPELEEISLVAALHDIGLLELDPELTRASHDPRSLRFSKEEYFSHVGFSLNYAKDVLMVSERIQRGVLEHHESMDGTGYPSGLVGARLSEYGQHIHLYDTLFSVYQNYYRPLQKNLADIIPVIRINMTTHFGAIADQIVKFLDVGERAPGVFFSEDNSDQILNATLSMLSYSEKVVTIIQSFTHSVGFRHDDRALLALQNGFFHIALAMFKSESLDKQKICVLEGKSTLSESDKKLLEDSYFLLRELFFHFNKFTYQLGHYAKHCNFPVVLGIAQNTLAEIHKLKTPDLPAILGNP